MYRSEFRKKCFKEIEDIADEKIGMALERFANTILKEYKEEVISEKEAKWLVDEIMKRYNGEDEVKFYLDLKEEMKGYLKNVTSGYLRIGKRKENKWEQTTTVMNDKGEKTYKVK